MNQYEFFKPGNQYEFFKNVELTVDGKIMVAVDNVDDLIQALIELQSAGTQTTITVEEFTYELPKTVVTTVVRPLPTPDAPPIVYNNLRRIVTPPPVEITRVVGELDPMEMVQRICSTRHPINTREVRCMNCVLAYHAANPDAGKGAYTIANTGCSTAGIPKYDKFGIIKGYY